MEMWTIWLIAAGVFLAIEIVTVGFLVFWLAIGALLAMVVSFIFDSIIVQTAVFLVSSTILILLTKPLTEKYINKPTKPTNVDSLIKKHGIVITDINSIEGTGQVKVNGEVWSAKCSDDITIIKGTDVEVTNIDGVKLVVKPLKTAPSK